MTKMTDSPRFQASPAKKGRRLPAVARTPVTDPLMKIEIDNGDTCQTRWTICGSPDNRKIYTLFEVLEFQFEVNFLPCFDDSLPPDLQQALAKHVSKHRSFTAGSKHRGFTDGMVKSSIRLKGLQCSITGDNVAMSLDELKEMAADPEKIIATQVPQPAQDLSPSLAYAAEVELQFSGEKATLVITSRTEKITAIVEEAIAFHVPQLSTGRE